MNIQEAQAILLPMAGPNNYWERKQLAKNTNDPVLLSLLVDDEVATVRREVAVNRATPGHLLHQLAIRPNPGVNIIKGLTENPNLEPHTIDYLIETINVETHGEHLHALLYHHPDVTAEQLKRLWDRVPYQQNQYHLRIHRGIITSYKNFPINTLLNELDFEEIITVQSLASNPNLNDEAFGMILRALPNHIKPKEGNRYSNNANHTILNNLIRNPSTDTDRLFALVGFIEMYTPTNVMLLNFIFSRPQFPIEVAFDYMEADERFVWGFGNNPGITPEVFNYILAHPKYPLFSDREKVVDDRNQRWVAQAFLRALAENPGVDEMMKDRIALHPTAIKYKEFFFQPYYKEFTDRNLFALFSQDKALPLEYLDNDYGLKRIVRKLVKYHEPEVATKAKIWLDTH